jgi:hypothetical protein
MVCMIFIVHTIASAQPMLKMCSPDAYGSLHAIGGRFNAGAELDHQTLSPWPALYLAENYETAFREKFQTASDGHENGLTAQELALEQGCSHSAVMLRGELSNVFDMTSHEALAPLARIFRRINMPQRARQLKLKLGIKNNECFMVQTSTQVYNMLFKNNWRQWPIQFGLPAQSQTIAELVKAAGFEAILYRSSKGPGNCLAVFPELLADGSFIELVDSAPDAVKHCRLDTDTASELEGWDTLPRQLRTK